MQRLDLDRLKRSAIAYLARYAASRAMLREVLKRRVRRWAQVNAAEPEAVAAALGLVEEAVEAATRAGLVDDARFAAGRTVTLSRRGWPARRIRAALSQKGIEREMAANVMEAAAIDDRAAARRFAERRRFGPWQAGDKRAERREKDLAAMVRAGFSIGDARAAIDGEVP